MVPRSPRSTMGEMAYRRPNRTTKNARARVRARATKRAARRRELLVALLTGGSLGLLLALGYVPSAL